MDLRLPGPGGEYNPRLLFTVLRKEQKEKEQLRIYSSRRSKACTLGALDCAKTIADALMLFDVILELQKSE
jgi:hypothetical protein